MTTEQTRDSAVVKPIIMVGFLGVVMAAYAPFQPDNSIIFVEEPDVIRKREVRDKIAGHTIVRDLISWEFHLPGKADEFYYAHPELDPAAVIGLSEYGVPFAARLSERYGLPGATLGAAQILRDKALLRQVSRAAGIANPESVRVRSPEDVRAFMSTMPGPIVLKPANREASVGTQVIGDPAEIDEAWRSCVVQDEGALVPDRPMELYMLAERFVEGAEYSVEMLVRGGVELFANVTGKRLFPGPRPVESGHVVPADIAPELTALLGRETLRVLRAVGFGDGVVHCEWIVCDGVPYLVECAGRLAGDGIVGLIESAYPVEFKRLYVAVMKGEPVSADALPRQAKAAAASRFLAIEPGVITAVRGVEAAAKAEGVVRCAVSVAPGDRSDGLRCSWDRVGSLAVSAATPADALRLVEAAAALIEISVSPAGEEL